MAFDPGGMEILSRARSLTLLASRRTGRIAFNRDALPAIEPVNYAMLGETIVFATSTGSTMPSAIPHNVIAFEVDSLDPETYGGWSVVVVGVAQPLTEDDMRWGAAQALNLQPWIGHKTPELICLLTDSLTGRSVASVTATATATEI